MRPKVADMSERHHEQTCLKVSALLMPDIDIIHNANVSTDINTDRPENSASRSISDVNLFKCNAQDTQGGRHMEGMTKSRQEELSGLELVVAGTDKKQLPTSYSLEQSESIMWRSRVEYLWCTVVVVHDTCGARFHISAAPIVCIQLAGSLHI